MADTTDTLAVYVFLLCRPPWFQQEFCDEGKQKLTIETCRMFPFRTSVPWETDIQVLVGQQIDVEITQERSSTGYQTTSISHNFVSRKMKLCPCTHANVPTFLSNKKSTFQSGECFTNL